jgi:sugar phosphate isomerase/epimerase
MIGKVGLQLYTLRSFLKTETDIRSTLKKVKEIGYNTVQVSGLGPIEPKVLKEILNEFNLKASSSHIGYNNLINEPEKILEEAKLLGYETVACPSLPNELRNEAGYKKAAKELSKVGKFFYENGLILVYHNHAFELQRYNSGLGLEILFNESDPKYLQTEIDTYWIQFGGGDPAEWILRYKDRAPIVHIKDMAIRENKQIMIEIGNGNLNWPKIFEALKEAKTKWYMVEQDDTNELNPFESVKISLNNLKKMGIYA